MTIVRPLAVATALALGLPSIASAEVDQFWGPENGGMGIVGNFQQQVTAGIGGMLSSVQIWTFSSFGTSFRFYVNRGTGWQSDPDDFSLVVRPADTDLRTEASIDVSGAGLLLAPGDRFVIGVQKLESGGGSGSGGGFLSPNVSNPSPLYVDGQTWAEVHPDPSVANWTMAYQTNVTPVPEPASLVTMLAGLALLRATRRLSALR